MTKHAQPSRFLASHLIPPPLSAPFQNFNFQFFDLAYQPPDVSRSSQCIVRVWARRPKRPAWVFLLEEFVDLRRLNFIGGLMGRRFPSNALLFHLEDGLYSMDFPNNMAEPKQAPPVSTSSYTALMKLANLESSVDDALETRHQIVEQINKILEETPTDGTDAATEAMALAHKYTGAQQRANSLAEKRLDELRRSLESRRAAMAQGRDAQARAEDDMVNNREKLVASRAMVMSTEQQIHGQRRRICSELSTVFPILPVPNAPPLSFQIRDIALPNSVYNATTAKAMNEDVLSAALGLVTLLTHNLQYYLGHPLPYLLFPYGSHSYARDDISQLPDKSNSRREFPLYLPRGGSTVGQWRFEYAWFLLNKDIEALCASQGLRVVDIRHTLPNLKYLLYVCSAGTDEIPERKKGGVRGLWAGRLRGRALPPLATKVPVDVDNVSTAGSSTGSRRGSIDSEVARRHEDDLRRAVATADEHIDGDGRGAGAGAGEMGTSGSGNGAALPFSDGDTMLTLRTKGLRERE